MQETVCQFGPNNALFGILTTPDADKAVPSAPIAVILNAGIIHRVGPFRLHVDLARQLAEKGYSTLRMDLSGLGDSQTRPGKLDVDEDRAVLDASDALDYLSEETGTDRFVILGLCSGAFNAHQIAVKDSRIVGSVFMDGIVFRTFSYYLHRYFLRFFRLRFWRNAIKRRWSGASNASISDGDTLAESEFFFSDELDKDVVVKDLNGMMDRGMRLLFLYTDGYDDICSRSQFREMYGLQPDNGQLQVEYYPKSEHTFRLIENRRAACSRVTSWFESQFSV